MGQGPRAFYRSNTGLRSPIPLENKINTMMENDMDDSSYKKAPLGSGWICLSNRRMPIESIGVMENLQVLDICTIRN